MRQLPRRTNDRNVLVSSDTADDAGVYRINASLALVQTADFFTPIVDDPFTYGQIAAANALSDIYAMGGRPLTALNLLGVPQDLLPLSVISDILRGGLAKAKEARCAVIGGHTIRNPEPIYGMAVTGTVSPKLLITNSRARPKDWLVLTKPLGTGIVTTAIKRALASRALQKRAITVMGHLNSVGTVLGERAWVNAGTDVTGFGLLGHLASMCRASGVGAVIRTEAIPTFGKEVLKLIEEGCIPGGTKENLKTAEAMTEWIDVSSSQKYLLADAQTSGGLLLSVRPKHLEHVLDALRRAQSPSASVIGRIERSSQPRIRVCSNAGMLGK